MHWTEERIKFLRMMTFAWPVTLLSGILLYRQCESRWMHTSTERCSSHQSALSVLTGITGLLCACVCVHADFGPNREDSQQILLQKEVEEQRRLSELMAEREREAASLREQLEQQEQALRRT
jgi:hypothetical protein